MKQSIYLFFLLIGLAAASCTKQIDSKQTNPNVPSSVPPQLILGTLLNDMAGNGPNGSLGGTLSWGNVGDWDQYHCQNYDYYGDNIYRWAAGNASFDPYLVMQNEKQMEAEAKSRGAAAVNPYEAVGRFVKAFYYYNLTSLYGDVPLETALQGAVNTTPTYTPQEKVFAYILSQLDSANTELASLIAANDNSLSATQDIYYNGNLSNWQKAVNSFKLRVLVSLSTQSSDATLNVPSQFANIVNNPSTYPVFSSEADNLQFVFNPGGTNTYSTYPFNPSNFGSIAGRFNMAATYVGALTNINDPRVFMTCDPAWALVTNVDSPAQYSFFVGASTGLDLGQMYSNASAGKYSFIGRYRYYSNFTGDPDVLVGYDEMCFNIAEGIERGWAPGNAETWYQKGITTNMAFYNINTGQQAQTAYFLPPGANSVTQVAPYSFNFDWNAYYAQPAVKLSATTATAINQIVLQKYIVCFENSGYEGYYNWRRTGVPAFQGGSGVGNNGMVPLRWAYPIGEQTQNAKNWQAAISSQGFSADDLNQTMWLIK
ncbi:MAG TPA: SusD/RagB family nutrient-binding outer membrane lipoprotein [Puia sp.]|nr:SusD/RagB family nutrient-binding outer membrane lipoprotein [Puia sp.]